MSMNMNMNNFGSNNTYYQPYFLQSQGNVYMIESPQDVANVPVGAGVSVAINLKDGLVYLKAIQNGVPMLLGYKLCPLDVSRQTAQNTPSSMNVISQQIAQNASESQSVTEPSMEQRIIDLLETFENRLNALENPDKKSKGGAEKWQI